MTKEVKEAARVRVTSFFLLHFGIKNKRMSSLQPSIAHHVLEMRSFDVLRVVDVIWALELFRNFIKFPLIFYTDQDVMQHETSTNPQIGCIMILVALNSDRNFL